jgi:hypothetical protein
MTPLDQEFKVLTREDAEQFVEDGYVIIPEVFPREVAEGVLPLLWQEMDEDPDDRSTWTKEGVFVGKVIDAYPASEVVTQRYRDAAEDLGGIGRLEEATFRGIGYAPIRFPMKAPAWEAVGFHVDGSHFHHHVDSRTQGLVGLDVLTDIDPEGGGTSIRPGSHRLTAGILAESEPEGMEFKELSDAARHATETIPAMELCGKAGDLILMHPHLVHGSSFNLSNRVRMAANRCIGLNDPMEFQRDCDEDYSLVEWAIREIVLGAGVGR